jgi:MYXO-CTERM domain-containing protein
LTVNSTFAGTQSAGFTLTVGPGQALANADLEVSDADNNDIEVVSVNVTPSALTGVTAPAASAPATGPFNLTWSGTADASAAPGNYVYAITLGDAVTSPVTFTVTITLTDVAPTHTAGANAISGNGTATSPYAAQIQTGKVTPLAMANVSDENTGQSLLIATVVPGAGNPTGGAGFDITLLAGVVTATPTAALKSNDIGTHRFTVSVTDGTNVVPMEVSIKVVSPKTQQKASDDGCVGKQGGSMAWLLLAALGLPALLRRRRVRA